MSPSWQAVPTALGINRVNSCAVLLATGQVCLIGGVQTQNPDNDHKPAPEIYEPGIDWATGVYTSNESWSVNAAETPQLSRNYHSVALLLPNGSVLTAGSNKNAASGNPDTVGIKKIELYEPNYPAGPRPTVSTRRRPSPTATRSRSPSRTPGPSGGSPAPQRLGQRLRPQAALRRAAVQPHAG